MMTTQKTSHLLRVARRWSCLALLSTGALINVACDDEEEPITKPAGEVAGDMAGDTAGDMAGDMPGDMAGEQAGEPAGDMAGEVAGDMAGEVAGDMAGEGAGDMAGEVAGNTCRGGQDYGITSLPQTLATSGAGPFTSPRLAALPDGAWLLSWLGGSEASPSESNHIHIQRFDEQFAPVGDATIIGRAKGGEYELHVTSTGAVVLWVNQRSALLTNEGVYLQSLDANGAPQGERVVINGTFDVRSISSSWADGFGGMLVYADSAKLSAIAFDSAGLSSESTVLAESATRSPTVTFAGGGWTVGWLMDDPNAAGRQVMVTQLNDAGEELGEAKSLEGANAGNRLDLAYGNGIYAVAWTFPDPTTLDPNPRDIIAFRLLDETLNEIGRFFVMDGTTDLALHSLSWISPSLFAVAWSQSPLGGEGSLFGLSRINQLGQVLPPVIVPHEAELYSGVSALGNASAMRVVMSVDPTPQPTGLFSAETVIQTAPLGPCEE